MPRPPSALVARRFAERAYLALVAAGFATCVVALATGSTLLTAVALLAFGAAALVATQHAIRPGTVLALSAALVLSVPARFVLDFVFLPLSLTIGIGALGLWFIQRLGSRGALARTDLLIFGLLGAALLSQAVGLLRVVGVVELAAANRRLLELVALCGVALFTADSLPSREAIERVLVGVVAGCSISALIGLTQWSTGFDVTSALSIPGLTRSPAADEALSQIYLRGDLARITGSTLHPIELGVLLAMSLPLSLHLLRRSRALTSQLVAMLSLAISALAIPLTLSRSAVLGVVVAVLATLPWLAWKSRLTLVGFVIVAGFIATAAFPAATSVMREIIDDPTADGGSIEARQSDYELIEEYFAERPILGRGWGSFAPTEYFWIDNQYLRTLIESGAIGLLALLSVYIGTLATAARIRRRSLDPSDQSVAQSLFAAVAVCVIAAGTFDALAFLTFSFATFLLIGCTGALDRLTRTPEDAFIGAHAVTRDQVPSTSGGDR